MFASILVNSTISLAQFGLLALSLTLIYSLIRLPNFAQGELLLVGGYSSYALVKFAGLPLVPAAILGVVAAGLCAVAGDRLIFRRLRKAPVLTLMIVSFGLSIVMQNVIMGLAGPNQINLQTKAPTVLTFHGLRVTDMQLVIIGAAFLSVVATHVVLFKTRVGRAIRAVAADPSLASARAINSEQIIALTWFGSGCLAGLCGVLVTLETGLWPFSGSEMMLAAFAAVTLGGIGSFFGALAAAAVLAFAENLLLDVNFGPLASLVGLTDAGSAFLPTGYKPIIIFVALLAVLIVRSHAGSHAKRWTFLTKAGKSWNISASRSTS